MVSVAISFLVMIIAVSVSSGFRREIRSGIASVSGDIQLTPADMNYIGEESPVSSEPPSLGPISAVQGVKSVQPVIYRAGIVKKEDNIHGVIFKGVTDRDSLADLGISIPDPKKPRETFSIRRDEILGIGKRNFSVKEAAIRRSHRQVQ